MPVDLERIAAAYAAIDPSVRDTPQFVADELRSSGRLLLKIETVNPVRSFKGRGCDWLMRQLPTDRRVVAATAGNFGQGLAWAARQHGVSVVIFAATTASPDKIARMRALGAEVQLLGDDFDEAKEAAAAWATEHAALFVEDGDHPAVTEGAGTIGLELDRWPGELTRVYVPLGNGALCNGVGAWFRAHRPDTEVVGVVAAGAPAMALSFERGRPVSTESVDTVADGIAVRVPVPAAVDDMVQLVHRVERVTDAALLAAVRAVWDCTGLVVEPAGAAGVAAALPEAGSGLAATILTGS